MNSSTDLQFPILLTLEEASQGTQRDFFYPTREMLCSRCGGMGNVNGQSCEVCEGFRRTYIPKKITVNVPSGVNDQVRIRINGQGLLSSDLTQWGDLYLVCYLRPHVNFQREAFDLITTGDLTARQNGKLTVSTLSGPAEISLAEGFSEEALRLAGHGLPRRIGGGERGDLVIRFVSPPQCVTAEEFKSRKQQAQRSVESKDFERAIQHLDGPECQAGHDAESRALLGFAYARLNDHSAARKHFKLAAELEPRNPSHLLAPLSSRRGRDKGAGLPSRGRLL